MEWVSWPRTTPSPPGFPPEGSQAPEVTAYRETQSPLGWGCEAAPRLCSHVSTLPVSALYLGTQYTPP